MRLFLRRLLPLTNLSYKRRLCQKVSADTHHKELDDPNKPKKEETMKNIQPGDFTYSILINTSSSVMQESYRTIPKVLLLTAKAVGPGQIYRPIDIVIEKYGGVTTLNIDRQKCRNSLDEATLKEIAAALDVFDKDETAKVLVFNGEGGTFCSGFDMNDIAEKGYNNLKDAAARLMRRPLCDKVTIAAVAGYAVAEGFELALACDLRIVEDTAALGCLGRRFGIPQSLYGSRRLTSLIGLSPALDLLITGRLISGKEAFDKGLAYKLTATGTSLGESIKLAKSIVKFPQNAIMMDKMAAVNSQLNPNSEESMRDEAIMTSLLGAAIEDIKEGVKKFQRGIGKHGKFYKLTEMPLKDWELEESYEETIVHDECKKEDK